MKRSLLAAAGCIGLIALVAAPAIAAVDDNPNAVRIANVSCPDAGMTFEAVWLPSGNSVVGHSPDDHLVGVAKSFYATDATGNPLVELFHHPGAGLDSITSWCYWADSESPTGYIGADIVFNANVR